MAEERVFGGIASKVLMENDRVRIWEMRLAPGEESDLHRHDLDYIMIQVAGDKMAARFEPDSGGEWVGLDYVEGEIVPGNVLYAKRGGIETAVNVGKEEFYEIVVELKDSTASAKPTDERWAALGVVLIGTLIVSLDSTIVGVALPQIGTALGAGSDIQWVITANLLALCVSMPAAGWIANRFGAKPVFLVALAAFSGASLCAALAPNLGFLIVARVGQGLCAGVLNPISMTIVLDLFAPEERGRAIGIWGLVAMSAPAIGPTLGGYLVTAVSWHWLFLPNVPIGIIGAIAGRRLLVGTPRRTQGKLDIIGLVLGGSGLALFIFGLSQSRNWGWSDPATIACLAVALALLATFTRHALRSPEPLLELRLTRTPVFLSSLVVIALLTLPQYARAVFIPLQLEQLRGYSALKVGLILTPSAIMTALSMSVGGRLVDRMGARRPAVTGCVLMIIGAALNAFISPTTSVWWISGALAVQGIGVGMAMIPVTVVGLNAIAPESMAHATTIRSLNNQVGAALSVAAMFALVDARLATATSIDEQQAAYNSVFIVAIVALAVAAVVAWRMPATGTRPHAD